ncbi:MAG: WD40/YVTN/BNR-like repeat-containing protein [Planctomycetota bacterium]
MKEHRFFLLASCLCLLISPVHAEEVKEDAEEDKGPMSAATFKGLKMRGIGPALMSGRIADIVIHPEDSGTWYVAVGSGNIWKTTNAGTTWSTIFDQQGSYSIGCITLDPNNPEFVWVGTGENVGGRHVGYGDGVYRSLDGGASWKNMGLKQSEHIGNIVVDPRDSNVVYVAAQGPLWSAGGERGLFKTTDGGETWENILSAGEYTGVNEVRMDPRNPDVLYASTHQRFRNVAALINGGPESGIHKSTDGGATWRKLEKGLPKEDMGKIGLAISPQQPNVIYATIELAHRKGGFYRSADAGESWKKQNGYISGGTGPHYYQEIFASPHKFDRVYQMDVRMNVTEDGGKTFRRVGEKHKHGDNHALAFVPHDPDYLLAGSDGGLYESWDLGKNWKFIANLPVTQFYKVAIDYDEPFYNVVGGTQDNATQHGPSRTDNRHGIRNSDWMITVFGDGHQPAIDPTNPNIIYSQWQQGNLVRHDRKTGEIVSIKPQPADGEEADRFNWDSPILISSHDPARLYFAGQRVWRSDNRGDSWTPISDDLSRGLNRLEQPMMGRVWSFDAVWDLQAMSMYGTVTSISESPVSEGLIYAGTDDGLIQITEDGGRNWRRVERLPGVPENFFVNDIKADLHDADTVYVCVDNHKFGDFKPYVLKSTDRGNTWTSIAGDLPERHLVWRLVQDHVKPNLLFVGTEFGVFFTVDGGAKWIKLSGGVPNIPFRDLVIQTRENDLVGATFGRGFYILDDYTPLRDISEEVLDQEAELFSVRDAWWYVQRATLGFGTKASQGGAFYAAPNPPFGAVFTYYLKDSIQTRKEKRKKEEKKLAKEDGDAPFPGWEALREEELEEKPTLVLTRRDASNNVVRHLAAPAKKGIHRVSWSLTYPAVRPWAPAPKPDPERDTSRNRDDGALVPPGQYSVHLAKRVEGRWTDLGKSQTFNVVPLRDGGTLPGMTPEQFAEYTRDLMALQRSVSGSRKVLDDTATRLKAIRETLDRSLVDDQGSGEQVRALERQVAAMKVRLSGNRQRSNANMVGPVSIMRRYNVANGGLRSLYGPTPTQLEAFAIAKGQFAALKNELDLVVGEKLPELEKMLDKAGLPWTPGRGVPGQN